jgi:hypothetical protein
MEYTQSYAEKTYSNNILLIIIPFNVEVVYKGFAYLRKNKNTVNNRMCIDELVVLVR